MKTLIENVITFSLPVACSPGSYYSSVNGTTECAPCPKDTYQEMDGADMCMSCPQLSETLDTGSRWNADCIGKRQ